jgi:hypothetical protein
MTSMSWRSASVPCHFSDTPFGGEAIVSSAEADMFSFDISRGHNNVMNGRSA